jgi:hypothetical protein
MGCVRRDWASKRATQYSKPRVRLQRTVSILKQRELEQKKKSVTWADQITKTIPLNDFQPLAGGASLSTQEISAPIVSHGDSTNLLLVQEDSLVDDVVPDHYTELEPLLEISGITEANTGNDCIQTPQPTFTADGTEATNIPFESASSLAGFRVSSTLTQIPERNGVEGGTWCDQLISRSPSHEVSGRDGDLTELSNSQEEVESRDGSSSEADVNDVRR